MLYTTDGNPRAEDHALRSIARSKVHSALAQVEAKQARLVERLVVEIDARLIRQCSADHLLDMVQNHPILQPEQTLISRYTDAFPELKERVLEKRNRMIRFARRRIEEALAPFEYQRRFTYTKGLHQ